MQGTIFTEAIRRGWRNALYWGIGLGILGLFVLTFIPDMDALKRYEDLLKTLPPALLQSFGINPEEQLTPESFVGSFLFARMLLFISVFGVLAGLELTANDEDSGSMDMLLSLPVPRWRVLMERFAATIVFTLMISLLTFVGLWVGSMLISIPFNVGRFLETSLTLAPLLILIASITALFSVLVRRKLVAVSVTALVVIVAYFLDALASAVSSLASLRPLSFYAYADMNKVMSAGIQWGDWAVMLVVVGVLMAITLNLWQKRDVGL